MVTGLANQLTLLRIAAIPVILVMRTFSPHTNPSAAFGLNGRLLVLPRSIDLEERDLPLLLVLAEEYASLAVCSLALLPLVCH